MSAKARLEYADFRKLAPAAQAALTALSKAVEESGLDKTLVELVKIRASQINGCAFCLQYHLNLARKLGVAAEKLDLVAVWHDAGIFSPREMAALEWAEIQTAIADGGVSDETYATAREAFSESELVFLTVAIATINAWNRIGVSLRFSPPIPCASEGSR